MKTTLTRSAALVAGLAVAGSLAVNAAAQTPKWEDDPAAFQIELRHFFVDVLKASTLATGSVAGNALDLVDTVGVEEEGLPEVRFALLPSPGSRIRIGYTRIRFDGESVVPGLFHFQGSEFGNGAEVKGELRQDYFYINWDLQPFEIGDEAFRFGFVLGLHGWKSEVTLYNRGPEVEASKDFNNLFPALGLAFDWTPTRYFTMFVSASGVHQGEDGWHLDAEGGFKICPVQPLAIVLAYRQLEFSNEEHQSDSFGRWTIRGPFAGIDIRF